MCVTRLIALQCKINNLTIWPISIFNPTQIKTRGSWLNWIAVEHTLVAIHSIIHILCSWRIVMSELNQLPREYTIHKTTQRLQFYYISHRVQKLFMLFSLIKIAEARHRSFQCSNSHRTAVLCSRLNHRLQSLWRKPLPENRTLGRCVSVFSQDHRD